MVFGQVLEGMDVVRKIVACGSEVNGVFFSYVTLFILCGILLHSMAW